VTQVGARKDEWPRRRKDPAWKPLKQCPPRIGCRPLQNVLRSTGEARRHPFVSDVTASGRLVYTSRSRYLGYSSAPRLRAGGSGSAMHLVVSDILAAREQLLSGERQRSVPPAAPGAHFQPDAGSRSPDGPRARMVTSYSSYATSSRDPDGNSWALQEVTRLPDVVDHAAFASVNAPRGTQRAARQLMASTKADRPPRRKTGLTGSPPPMVAESVRSCPQRETCSKRRWETK